MQVYSDTLAELSLRGAAKRLALSIGILTPLPRPKLASAGWRVWLTRSNNEPASWHDYGYFLAQLYAADPAMKVRSTRPTMSYDSAAGFNAENMDRFTLPEPPEGKPKPAKSWRSVGMEVILPVAYGTVDVHFCGDGHATAYAGDSDQGVIVYDGRKLHVSMHLWAATNWTEDPGDPETEASLYPFSMYGTFGRGHVPAEVRDAVARVVIAAFRVYAEAHPEVLAQADVIRLEHELPQARDAKARAGRQFIDASHKVTRMENALEDARTRLAAAHVHEPLIADNVAEAEKNHPEGYRYCGTCLTALPL